MYTIMQDIPLFIINTMLMLDTSCGETAVSPLLLFSLVVSTVMVSGLGLVDMYV